MSSFIEETTNRDIFTYKIVDIIKKKNIIDNLCWFCNQRCSTFVKICINCEHEKFNKKRTKF